MASVDQTFVGKLATNVQESDGTVTPFSLITEFGGIKLKIEEEQFIRALHKLSGRILVVSGQVKDNSSRDNSFQDDINLDARNTSHLTYAYMPLLDTAVPTYPVDGSFGPFEGVELEKNLELNVNQYTVLVKEVVLEGVVRSEWADGNENYFIKIASGEDEKLTLIQDDQYEFFEKYHDKKVAVVINKVLIDKKIHLIVSQIRLK